MAESSSDDIVAVSSSGQNSPPRKRTCVNLTATPDAASSAPASPRPPEHSRSEGPAVRSSARISANAALREQCALAAQRRLEAPAQPAAPVERSTARQPRSSSKPKAQEQAQPSFFNGTALEQQPLLRPLPTSRLSEPDEATKVQLLKVFSPENIRELGTDGIIAALAHAVDAQPAAQLDRAFLCGRVISFCQKNQPDTRYGCGFRNIQVMLSYLQRQGPEYARRVFSGMGIPSVAALQRSIEVSWRSGFDVIGAAQLGWHLEGRDTWIGATDAAAFLRFLGFESVLVDFSSPAAMQARLQAKAALEEVQRAQAAGNPAQAAAAQKGLHALWSAAGVEVRVPGMTMAPSTSANSKVSRAKRAPGPSDAAKRLLPWVWRYFESAAAAGPTTSGGASGRVTCTSAPPLYLQYQGHSTSIVGIERRRRGTPAPAPTVVPMGAAPGASAMSAGAGRGRGRGRGGAGGRGGAAAGVAAAASTGAAHGAGPVGAAGRGAGGAPGVGAGRGGGRGRGGGAPKLPGPENASSLVGIFKRVQDDNNRNAAAAAAANAATARTAAAQAAPAAAPSDFVDLVSSPTPVAVRGAGGAATPRDSARSSADPGNEPSRPRGAGTITRTARPAATTTQTRVAPAAAADDEWEYDLLVLESQVTLEAATLALQHGNAWHRCCRRSAKALSMPAYQVLAVRGILPMDKREASKKLSSTPELSAGRGG